MTSTDHIDWLPAALAPGLTSKHLQALLAVCDSPSELTKLSGAELERCGLPAGTIQALTQPDPDRLASTRSWLEIPGHTLVPLPDERYPPLLRESGLGPAALFVSGNPDALTLPQLAVVGSRNTTPAGRENAHEFAMFLARAGLTITSGLATGIDTAAHEGALTVGNTIAVMGSGLDQVYPLGNAALAARIEQAGALVSEFAPGTPPRKHHFPQRNRIIAASSLGTLVIEAGIHSGSLITARFAAETGREVFAIPGSIHSPVSKGCHQLIRQGAKLVETGADIIEEIGILARSMTDELKPAAELQAHDADPEYAQLLDHMGMEPVTIEQLARRSGLTAGELSSMLLILELQGKVRTLPGGRFQQSGRWNQTHE